MKCRDLFVLLGIMSVGEGCDVPEVEGEEALASIEFRENDGGVISPPKSEGHVSMGGGWINNGLRDWEVSGIDPAFALDSWLGLEDDDDDVDDAGVTEGWLADGNEDEVAIIEYIVECALPLGEGVVKTIDGELVTLEGRLGLAPEWKTGPCDETCQQWVSACLLARRNAMGQTVELWIEASHPSVGFGSPPEGFHFEGAYFGNFFADESAELYACQGEDAGLKVADSQGRSCILDPSECGLQVFSDCASAGCQPSEAGLDVVGCQPVATGRSYGTIAVHVAPQD